MRLTDTVPERSTSATDMSTVEAAGRCEEEEYRRAAKRLKMEEMGPDEKVRRGEELEEGEDSDNGSLPANDESVTNSWGRWSVSQQRVSRDDIN